MDLDDFIITVVCVVDEMIPAALNAQRLRQRGPAPRLTDSEVITMEVVGEYLGLEQDRALFAYFRRHYAHFFPALRTLHRTTFIRQAANLWRLKERLWQQALGRMPHDPTFAIVDSFPLPVCQFARAYRFVAATSVEMRPLARIRWRARRFTACGCTYGWSGQAPSHGSASRPPMCTS
jgi:hypothetical protein